ncbi:MAG: UDP-3-O-(3-hydroxymyristoyl)glucosamine N-acyltransferase, partial [Aquificaceae bacterium]|nr:UDP-3-O-(3-hydroxymyristoyl)glucosamine N-acyltransferase [Aquificaceae bacterium]
MNLWELSKLLEGQLRGDGDFQVQGVSSPEYPKEGTAIFCKPEQVEKLKGMQVALVVTEEVDFPRYVKVKNLRLALAKFLSHSYPEKHPCGVSPKAHIEEEVKIGENAYVGPFVFVGRGAVLEEGVKVYPFCYVGEGVRIGRGSVLFSGVHVYPGCVIGQGVSIHRGSVIGADGFG